MYFFGQKIEWDDFKGKTVIMEFIIDIILF